MENFTNIRETSANVRPRTPAALAGLQCVKPFSQQDADRGNAWLAAKPEVLADT